MNAAQNTSPRTNARYISDPKPSFMSYRFLAPAESLETTGALTIDYLMSSSVNSTSTFFPEPIRYDAVRLTN